MGRPTGKRARRQARHGFTMVELLIAVAIIGIMAMTVAPSLVDQVVDNRHANARWELARFARAARERSLAYGQASLLRFQRSEANGLGTVELYVGMTNNCRQVSWGLLFGVGRPAPPASRVFDMTQYNPHVDNVDDDGHPVIRMTANGSGADRPAFQLCYASNGTTWFSFSAAPGALTEQQNAIVVEFTRSLGGIPHGVPRRILFQAASTPRLL